MIRSIYLERYKTILITICLLVIGIGVFNAVIQNNQWKNLYNNHDSRTEFEANRDEYTYYDESKMASVSYKSYEEYRKATLLFYGSYSPYVQGLSLKTISKADNYSNNIAYTAKFGHFYMNVAILLLVPLVGFLLFFIDQKTGFNQFLFSLGLSRKELFKKKICYIALPFLLSTLIGQSLYALLIHSLIPAAYMNATLAQLFTSVLSNFCLLFLMFCSSAFIGSMVGNIVFGPLTWFVFWWMLLSFPNAVYSLGNHVYIAKGIFHKQFSETLFVYEIGKMGGHWWMNLILIILGLLLILWAYKKYQTLSLENDNAYLLHKESRWPIWCVMTIFTSFILNLSVFDPWSLYLVNQTNTSIKWPIINTIMVFIIVGLICAFVVFSRESTKKVSHALDILNQRMG